MKFKNPFATQPSIEEMQEREERDNFEMNHAKAQALIAKLDAEHKRWQDFSPNGKKSGVNWDSVRAWLKGNKKK